MDPGEGAGKYLNLALLLPISTLVGFAMGYGLDMLFHTLWIRYVFLVLGAIAGFVEAFRVLTEKPGGDTHS
jgi:F0F1-type ATP synthase assembly protein I